jgi:hypothetical protein
MGVFQLPGLIQPAMELQARWVTSILTGRIKLPQAEQMSELIASEEEEQGRQVPIAYKLSDYCIFIPIDRRKWSLNQSTH